MSPNAGGVVAPPRSRRSTIQASVLERLRTSIESEELQPGAVISLRRVAEWLGVSTLPVRSAFASLAADGLVLPRGRRGWQVAPLSAEEFEELYMARLGPEGLAARLGAEQMTEETWRRLRDLARKMDEDLASEDRAAFLAHDAEFHALHYESSGRPRLIRRVDDLKRLSRRYTRRATLTLAESELTRRYHESLLAACFERDGRLAEWIVRRDLETTVQSLKDELFGSSSASRIGQSGSAAQERHGS